MTPRSSWSRPPSTRGCGTGCRTRRGGRQRRGRTGASSGCGDRASTRAAESATPILCRRSRTRCRSFPPTRSSSPGTTGVRESSPRVRAAVSASRPPGRGACAPRRVHARSAQWDGRHRPGTLAGDPEGPRSLDRLAWLKPCVNRSQERSRRGIEPEHEPRVVSLAQTEPPAKAMPEPRPGSATRCTTFRVPAESAWAL